MRFLCVNIPLTHCSKWFLANHIARTGTSLVFWLVTFLKLSMAATAQTPEITAPYQLGKPLYHLLDRDAGLSQIMVNGLALGPDGAVWVGTKDGLNRWDGYRSTVYRHKPGTPFTLPSSYITGVKEADNGKLWVISGDKVGSFDPATEAYSPITNNGAPATLPQPLIGTAENGIVLMVHNGNHLAWINTSTNAITKREHFPELGNITCWFNFKGKTYIGTQDGLWHYQDARVTPVPGKGNVHSAKVMADKVWLFYLNQVYSFSGKEVVAEPRLQLPFPDVSLAGHINTMATSVQHGNHALILVNWTPYWFNLITGSHQPFYPEIIHAWQGCLLGAFQDSSGTFWFPTNRRGVLYFHPKSLQFGRRVGQPLWKGFFHEYGHLPASISDTLQGNIWRVDIPNGNYLLLHGTHKVWDIKNRKWITHKDKPGWFALKAKLNGKHPLMFHQEADSTAPWLAWSKNQPLYLYDHLQDQFTGPLNWQLPHHWGVHENLPHQFSRNLALLRFRNHGAKLFQVGKAAAVATWKWDTAAYPALRSTLRLTMDPVFPKRYLWCATDGFGVYRLDAYTNQVLNLNTASGLPNDVVYALLPDKNGKLWGSTNEGLFVLDPGTLALQHYRVEHGLQSAEFNRDQALCLPNGLLLFGGISGYNLFAGHQIKPSNFQPSVVLSSLKINGQPLSFWLTGHGDSSITVLQRLRSTASTNQQATGNVAAHNIAHLYLRHWQNTLDLQWSSTDFSVPAGCKYKVMLQGAQDAFVDNDNAASITYASLPPGDYTLKIMVSNADGMWSNKVYHLPITIAYPWYQRWWAWVLYATIGSLLVLLGIRNRNKQLALKNEIVLATLKQQELEKLDQLKNSIFANITHEFRTPLTLILAPLETYLKQEQGQTQLHWLGMIMRNAQRLLDLVNQLLDLARLDQHKATVNPVNGYLPDAIDGLLQDFTHLAKEKGLSFTVHWPVQQVAASWDHAKLERCLINLVGNAIKFTDTGGITFSVELALDHALFSIRDTGPGIAQEHQDQIWKRFFQVAAQQPAGNYKEGTGIGLALVHELVSLVGGEIRLKSQLGHGSLFTLKWPLQDARWASSSTAFSAPTVAVTDKSVEDADEKGESLAKSSTLFLVVDDNQDIQAIISHTLSTLGTVITANNGHDAWLLAQEHVPDLVITDVMMPVMDGLQFTKLLADHPLTCHIPVLMLTAKSSITSRIEGLQHGADFYLPKPFSPTELVLVVENHLKRQQAYQQYLAAHWKQLGAANGSVDVSGGMLPPPPFPSGSASIAPSSTSPAHVLDPWLAQLDNCCMKLLKAPHDPELLDVALLAQEMATTERQLRRKLSALLNMSPSEYIKFVKLRLAKQLLITTSEQVGYIALAVGFKSQAHFTRLFTEQEGCSPTVFRDAHASTRVSL